VEIRPTTSVRSVLPVPCFVASKMKRGTFAPPRSGRRMGVRRAAKRFALLA
jgi:hypothetical protein